MTDEQRARLNNVYNQRESAIAENSNAYDTLIGNAGTLKDKQDSYASQYEQMQNQIADKNLAHQTELINQQKEQAQKDTFKEQTKALNTYEAFTNPYGTQSEIVGQNGLSNSGVSETMKLGAYNTYQNRVSQANTTLQNALTEYNNQYNEAVMNNDVTKMENALTKLQYQLESIENYYSNVSSLTQNKLSSINALNESFNSQYNTVYNQILNEQAQAEAIRQYNEQMAYQRERDAIADAQWQKEYQLSVAKANAKTVSGGTNNSISNNTNGSIQNNTAEQTATTHKAVSSPNLSNGKASAYFSQLAGNKALTDTELATIISKVDNKYSLSKEDKEKIYKSYGLNK